jgi:hypothetical protein
VSVSNHRSDEAVFDGDGHREVDASVLHDRVASEGGVDFRMQRGRAGGREEDKVIDRDFWGSSWNTNNSNGY